MVIPREARKITYSTEIRNLKKRLSLSLDQRSIMIGSMLGDGNLENNWSKTNYRFKISHSTKQFAYINWKYNQIKDWVLTAPKLNKRGNSVSFNSISHSEITDLAKLFYRGNKKIIAKELILNPLILAIWFMDDGNVIRRNGKVYGYHLNTQSFTKEENFRLIKLLRDTYNIIALPELNKGRYRLRIMQQQSRDRFTELVRNYIIPSMQYKIS